MPAEEGRTLNRDSLTYDDELRASGHYIASNALQSVQSAVTVRVRNKRISTSDGPFAETKEHLGGFILIDAATLDEAVRIASADPHGQIRQRRGAADLRYSGRVTAMNCACLIHLDETGFQRLDIGD